MLTKKIERKLKENEVQEMVYDYIDDSLDPSEFLDYFQDAGIDAETSIRRENEILYLIVEDYKFRIDIKRVK